MKNEIIEVLKTKESEMDNIIEEAKVKAGDLMVKAEEKYKVTKENILSKIDEEATRLRNGEEEKLETVFQSLKSENEKVKEKAQKLFEKNKEKAVQHVIRRVMEEILDQEDVKTSDRGAQDPS